MARHSHHARHRADRPAPPSWPLWLLAAALVVAQALGLVHRVLHASSLGHGDEQAHGHGHGHGHEHAHEHAHEQASELLIVLALPAAQADGLSPGAAAAGPLLFDDHVPGGEQCRLLDQAAQLDLLAGGPPALYPAPTGLARGPLIAAARAGGSAAGYHARGPPPGTPRHLPSA